MNPSHQQPELNLITTFLGVPGYVLSTFFPTIQHLAAKQPRLVKIISVAAVLSTFGATFLARIKATLLSFLISNFMFSTAIDASDPLYDYTMRWLKHRQKILPEQELHARSKEDIDRNQGDHRSRVLPFEYFLTSMSPTAGGTKEDTKGEVVYNFHGLQIFWHNWRPFFVASFPRGRTGPGSSLVLRCFGLSSRPLKDIIDEAYRTYRKSDQAQVTSVYRPVTASGRWKCVAQRGRRSLETIVLDPQEKGQLLEDIDFYLSTKAKAWYAARGIPYRRGYLFYGRPGTGKTSLSMAIAGHFGLDIYIVSLQDHFMSDTVLHNYFANLPEGALILLEDIDSAGLSREKAMRSLAPPTYRKGRSSRNGQPSVRTRVTLSGLLNVIDGADSPEGHILIMTTNAPDALDEALVRPGRIDYKLEFRAVGGQQAKSIFRRMYHGLRDESELECQAEEFARQIPEDTFTPAEIQGHLLRHKEAPDRALVALSSWIETVLHERHQLAEAQRQEARSLEQKRRKKTRKRKQIKQAELVRTGLGEEPCDSSSSSSSSSRRRCRSGSGSDSETELDINDSQPYPHRRCISSDDGDESSSSSPDDANLDFLAGPPPAQGLNMPIYPSRWNNDEPTIRILPPLDRPPPPPQHQRHHHHHHHPPDWNTINGVTQEESCRIM